MEQVTVIKIGGNIIDNEAELTAFLHAFSALKGNRILVHGGGRLATEIGVKLGIRQKIVDGRRITDAETLRVVTMVYAGLVNKQIVALLQAAGCNAMGLSGADGNILPAKKRMVQDIDYGFAGDIETAMVNTESVSFLLKNGFTPVICPITHDGKGQLLNTNADTIAQELARALSLEYRVQLVYCFEKPGVLLDVNDENSRIPSLNRESYANLKREGKIFAGMIPKLDNAFEALRAGVSVIVIGAARDLQNMTGSNAGTRVVNE